MLESFSIFLNICILALLGLVAYVVNVNYQDREDKKLKPGQIFQNMLKVNPSLSFRTVPTRGNTGDFGSQYLVGGGGLLMETAAPVPSSST